MKIVYASRTGNVQSFVDKLGMSDTLQIENGNETVNEKYVLITYTDGYGDLPEEVENFLEKNANNIVGVAASGDLGYGEAYCLSADVVANTYGVPIMAKFEADGSTEDVQNFIKELEKL
jgi:protein involved in ribonucleotide reduction